MKICVGTVWYNDPSIFRMIESIPKDWTILVVDGKFTGSPAKEDYSNEKIRNQVMSYPNVSLFDKTGMEYEVRNAYMQATIGYDYCLVIDSDEWITSLDKEVFYDNLKKSVFGTYLLEYNKGTTENTQYGRLIVDPHKWRHWKSHRFLEYNGHVTGIAEAGPMVKGIQLAFNEDLRPQELKDTIEQYQKQLWKHEETIRI